MNLRLNPKLKEKIAESLSAVLPITFIVLAVSVFLVPMDTGTVVMFFVGALMLIVGMGMFQLGSEMAMSPLGEGVGAEVAKSLRASVILLVSFIMGAMITLAEPDLQVLSNQVPSIPNFTLIATVAVGVGIFLALAVARIVMKIDLSFLLMGLYALLLIISCFVPAGFLPVAFDSGGVTTGPITVPFIMAMGVGLSSVRGDKNASSDSFGLVALSSIGPVLAVLILGCFYDPQAAYSAGELAQVDTMQDVAQAFAFELPRYAKEVFVAIVPILIMSLLFQLFTHRYQHRQKLRIAVGFGYTALGLLLFLCGVNVGFAPVGTQLGSQLAADQKKWLLVPIGVLIGYFIVKAEPAIQILNHQVQSVTNGTVSAAAMNRCLSIGVSVSVGLSMLRVITGLPIQFVIIPGYVLALAMSRFVPKIFVGIAFDSGGVASGPMTSAFLLPLCLGACQMLGGNVMTDAFGAIALVALTPLIAVQIMGLQYKIKLAGLQKEAKSAIMVADDSDDIVEIEEG